MEMKLFLILLSSATLLDKGASGVATDRASVSVMEGDSVTLHTGVVKTQQGKIRCYFNNNLIAQITGDLIKICSNVQCNEGYERFRDRLKLDHQTGSLTIMNTRNTDSGEYKLQINYNEDIFSVSVHGVSAAERDEVKRKSVKEGEPVTLDPGVIENPHDVLWYHNDTLIAEFTGDQSKICTDVQCKERFRDRLKLDHQTGSLSITNTRTTDSGLYRLSKHITISINSISSHHRSIKNNRFEVIVVDSGLSAGVITGISVVCVLLLVAVGAVAVIRSRSFRKSINKAVVVEEQLRASVESLINKMESDRTEVS